MACPTERRANVDVVAFVDDMSKKLSASNDLFDLCYRHIAASGMALRALGMPAPTATAHDAKEALLKRVSLVESLTNDELARLAARLSRHEYQANQQILASETVPDGLSIVHSGVLSPTPNRREVAKLRVLGRTKRLAKRDCSPDFLCTFPSRHLPLACYIK